MNAHGVAVERTLGRPIMSSLHAGWSFGGLAGSGGVALAVGARASTAGRRRDRRAPCCGWLALAITTALGAASAHSEHGSSGFALPSRGVLLIGALCFLVMVTEGAMGDWSGIYLKQRPRRRGVGGRHRVRRLLARHGAGAPGRRLARTPLGLRPAAVGGHGRS